MNEKSFINNIDDETLAKMIDKTLIYKKTAKSRSIKTNLLKILPAVAAIMLVIGAINIFPVIYNNNMGENGTGINPGVAVESSENISDTNIIETETAETVTTQIGELSITTPIITLPGGGTYYYKIENGAGIFKFSNGSQVMMFGGNISNGGNDTDLYSYITFLSNCTIEFKNGVTVEAPVNTKVETKNSVYTFTIGDGEATITQSDGTSSTIPARTVLDSNGNIVK